MTEITEGHTVKRFDAEMSHLNQMVLEMGGLVMDQMQRALHALDEEDPEAAREVIDRDRLVNDLDVKIDDELVGLLARRQPMARDLRDLITVGKTVTDLERVGDQTRKIALLVERLYENTGSAPHWRLLQDIHTMADMGAGMLRRALEAFDDLDLDKAVDVIREDGMLEEQFQSALRRLSTFVMEDSRTVGHVVEATLGLRALERIGGHAKNIAGYVIYLGTGKDVRHVDLESILQEIGEVGAKA
jgi:phosphate transport system protein